MINICLDANLANSVERLFVRHKMIKNSAVTLVLQHIRIPIAPEFSLIILLKFVEIAEIIICVVKENILQSLKLLVYSKIFYNRCIVCKKKFISSAKQHLCSNHRDHQRKRKKFEFKFNLSDYPDLFNFNLIKQYGWYSNGVNSPKNINGITRDHKVSVNEAIEKEYDPYYITHPLNCELMPWRENIDKHTNSSITYEELVEMVDKYDGGE